MSKQPPYRYSSRAKRWYRTGQKGAVSSKEAEKGMADWAKKLKEANKNMAEFSKRTNNASTMLRIAATGIMDMHQKQVQMLTSGWAGGIETPLAGAMHEFQPLSESQVEDQTSVVNIISSRLDPIMEKFSKGLKKATPFFTGAIGFIVDFLEKIGVLQPIMEILGIIFELIGAGVMQALMPALQTLIEAITSPEFMDIMIQIGQIIGEILSPILSIFAQLLTAVAPLLLMLARIFAAILIPIVEAFAPVFESLGPLFKEIADLIEPLIPIIKIVAYVIGKVLAYAFVIVANVIIFIVNIIIGIINLIGGLFGVHINPISPLPLPALAEGGIVTRRGVYEIAEEEPEAVIPLSKMGGAGGVGGGGDIVIHLEGGVYTQSIDELATMVARKIRLYRW